MGVREHSLKRMGTQRERPSSLTHGVATLWKHSSRTAIPYLLMASLSDSSAIHLTVRAWRLLDDIRFDPAVAKRTLIEEFGWHEYGGKHCDKVFTRTFQSVHLPMRFGIDKHRAYVASLIASGLLSRPDAMKCLTEAPMSQETAERNVAYLCKKLGFTPADWQKLITSPPVLHPAYLVGKFDRAIAT